MGREWFSPEELKSILRDRIRGILTRYQGKMAYVDVVNDALAGSGFKPDGNQAATNSCAKITDPP